MSLTFSSPRLCKGPWGPRGKGNLGLWLSWPQVTSINLASLTLPYLFIVPWGPHRVGKPEVMTFMTLGHTIQFDFSYTSNLSNMTICGERGCPQVKCHSYYLSLAMHSPFRAFRGREPEVMTFITQGHADPSGLLYVHTHRTWPTLEKEVALKWNVTIIKSYISLHSALRPQKEGKPEVMTFMTLGHSNQFGFSYTSNLKTWTMFRKRVCL